MGMFDRMKQQQAAAPAATAPQRSSYGGIVSAQTRDPLLAIGTYRLQILKCEEGHNPGKRRDSYKVSFRVVNAAQADGNSAGADVSAIFFLTAPGLADLKRLMVHACGIGPTLEQYATPAFDARAAYIAAEQAFDAEEAQHGFSGSIIEASAGRANGAPSIVGQLVDVIVSRGKDVPNPQTGQSTGDFFRVYKWGSVPSEERA